VRKSPQQQTQQVSCSRDRSREVPYHSIFAPHCRLENWITVTSRGSWGTPFISSHFRLQPQQQQQQ